MRKYSLLTVANPEPRERGALEVADNIRQLQPYQAVSSLESIRSKPTQPALKLDWNESTVAPSPRVAEAISACLAEGQLHWYPVLNSTNLIGRLADFHGLNAGQILVTNGSDEALATLCTTYLNPGDRVLVPSPSYTHFLVFAQAAGGAIVPHRYRDPFAKDLRSLLAVTRRVRPRMLYLVNPNNPTGVMYSPQEIAILADAHPEMLLLVDEAYSEFAGESCVELIDTYPNVAITRTFSKAYGLAGLRVGYCMAAEPVVRDLRRVANPKSVNVFAQVGAMAALEDQAHLNGYLREVAAAKAMLSEWLRQRGFEHHSTPANYVMVRFDDAARVCERLAAAGVYVRDRSGQEQLAGYVRFSIGTVDQTRVMIERLEAVVERVTDRAAR